MMTIKIDWNAIAKDVEAQVIALAEQILKEYAREATADARTFLVNSKDRLTNWSVLLANSKIDQDEYQMLVRSQLDLAELHALKQTGLAQVRIDMFINGIITILTSVVMSSAKGIAG